MVDRYGDVLAYLDRQLLSRIDPPSHADARELLKKHGVVPKSIVRVDPDAILYISPLGVAVTAWLHVVGGKPPEMTFESGFPCEPGYVQDKPESD